ncbi:MAG: TolC family protein, partial [Tannerellaceae bacterium]
IGFNQSAERFNRVYKDLMQQDIVGVSVSVPLVDWGVRKGKHNMAKNNLNVLKISSKQEELNIEEDVIMTVGDFNIQQDMISSAENALELASMAYDATKQRFLIGKADLNSLTLSQNREQSAQQNYIQALRNYWKSYFKIRKLTLYDFDKKMALSTEYDFKLEN